MVGMGEISGVASAINAGLQIVKAMVGLRDASLLLAKTIELQTILVEANDRAIAAQEERVALVKRIEELEKQAVRTEDWEAEKQRYEMTEAASGFFAYRVKPAMRGTQVPHYICAGCYDNGKAAPLNYVRTPGGTEIITCGGCGRRSMVSGYVRPS